MAHILRVHKRMDAATQAQERFVVAGLPFEKNDTANLDVRALAERFRADATAALGSSDPNEVFNAAADFAQANNVSWDDMARVLAERRVHREIPDSVLHAWHREGRAALGEDHDPNAIDIETNIALHEHATGTKWERADVLKFLYDWFVLLNQAFFGNQLPHPAISVRWTRWQTLGSYQPGRDGYGLRFNINVNLQWLHLPRAVILAVETHEMLHQWEEVVHGRKRGGTYHTNKFSTRAAEIGVPTGRRGHYGGINPKGPFAKLLEKHGVRLDEPGVQLADEPTKERLPSTQKWECGGMCTRIWASRGVDVKANCLRCNKTFMRQA